MNELVLAILKRKITSGEITVDDILKEDYKAAIVAWQTEATT